MKAETVIELLTNIQENSPKELDDATVKNLLESLDNLSSQEAITLANIIAPSETVSKDKSAGPKSLAVVLIRFLREHTPTERRIVYFKKFITKISALQSIVAETERITQEYDSFVWQVAIKYARVKNVGDKATSEQWERITKILGVWRETSIALMNNFIEPYQALLACEYASNDYLLEKYIVSDFASVIEKSNENNFDGMVTFWANLMPDISRKTLREIYLDSDKQSRAKENSKRALILLGEYNLLSSIETIEGDVFVGDVYNNQGQAGAFGANSKAHDIAMNQYNSESIDFEKLAQELAILQKVMKEKADGDEHDVAIGNIAMAKKAAQEKNGKTVSEKLKAAGKWAFEIATSIGTTVAAEAIKISLGLK